MLSHVSAISYVHKLLNKPDPTHSFIVRNLLQGAQKLGKSADSSLPIIQPILHISSSKVYPTQWQILMTR
jgi:hypothetical protein